MFKTVARTGLRKLNSDIFIAGFLCLAVEKKGNLLQLPFCKYYIKKGSSRLLDDQFARNLHEILIVLILRSY